MSAELFEILLRIKVLATSSIGTVNGTKAEGKCILLNTILQLIGEGNGSLLQYSCLGNPMDRGDWQAIIGSQKSQT